MKVLFIVKVNELYGQEVYCRRSAGLYNSTSFIVKALLKRGIDAHIVEVKDNNDIDREVTKCKPEIVIIEALWVVPEKFPVLMALHPNVKWFIHLHSNMPFLALEGIAMDWIIRCHALGVGLIANSVYSYEAIKLIIGLNGLYFLPNVYLACPIFPNYAPKDPAVVDIGCFGAVRPLKNQLNQAIAALGFARSIGKKLRFHMNATRIETNGDPVLKNISQLFQAQPDAELVRNKWYEPADFLTALQNIDIGMQVSLTETFNVVSADYVCADVPIVVSDEVIWASDFCKADYNSVEDMMRVMHTVYKNSWLTLWNKILLRKDSKRSQKKWFDFISSL